MGSAISVLLIEDSDDDAVLLQRVLREGSLDATIVRAQTEAQLAEVLEQSAWDVIISDHNLPGFSADRALALVQERGLDIPFIIVSGSIGEELAVAAMRAGAKDYVSKDRMARLPAAILREQKEAAVRRARMAAEKQVRFMAYFDVLTGLPNRVHLQKNLEDALDGVTMRGDTLALLLVKLDGFKEVNNTFGHVIGDRVIKEAALRIRSASHGSHWVARSGVGEFSVLVPGVNKREALLLGRELARLLQQPIPIDDIDVEIAASIGIAVAPELNSTGAPPSVAGSGLAAEHAGDVGRFLQQANAAVAEARTDSTRVALYDARSDPYDSKRLALLGELRRAIDSDQLFLQYQPQVSVTSSELVRVEALVRWNHPRQGIIPPDRFVPLAEQSGLIAPMSRWVIREGLRQSLAWRDEGLDIPLAINLSARDLHVTDLPEYVEGMLAAFGIDPSRLLVEVTESALMTDAVRANELLKRLRDAGIRISIDDFGTGYSSLGNLRTLPLAELKVDKSFVSRMTACEKDRAIVDATVGLGHSLNLEVVAEGVEDLATWNQLAASGCDIAQGYYISRGINPAAIEPWLRDWKNRSPVARSAKIMRARSSA